MERGVVCYLVFLFVPLMGATPKAWDRIPDNGPLRINLRTGRVTGFSEYIFFESIVQPNRHRNRSQIYAAKNGAKRPRDEAARGCSMQAVLKIKMSNAAFSGLHFQMTYHRPKLWSLHLSSSPKSKGFGWTWGSGTGTISELQIHNKQLRIYSGDRKTESLSAIKIIDDIFPKKGRSKVSMIVENNGLRWTTEENDHGQKSDSQEIIGTRRKMPPHRPMPASRNKKQSWAFQSDLIFDFQSYDSNASFLYVGLNRAVGTGAKYGSGLCAITITLQKPREKRDECRAANHICDSNAYCKRNRNSARCVCRPGFQGNGIRCIDENECSKNNGHCAQQCINTNGSHYCSCHKGFTLSANKYDCEDIDECRGNNGNCLHKCVNSLGSYKCVCDQGYILGADGFSCFQESRDALCRRLNCSHGCRTFSRNLAKCFCKLGFKLHPNGQDCVPTCLINNGGCQHRCINTVRGSICSCRNGYILGRDKTACFATCSIENGGCERICHDNEFGARCSCPHGYKLHADNKTCLDVDECSINNGNCHQLCINYPGTYECSCHSGYYLSSASNFRHCLDVDECHMNHTCDHYCVNRPGTFECKCRPGFHLHGSRYCGDINECSINNGGCHFECQNTIGSFLCKCPKDHFLHPNGKDCMRISQGLKDGTSKHNILRCSSKQQCALSCRGVESASMRRNQGFSIECFTATYDQICLGELADEFDKPKKMNIQISSLVDKCEYVAINDSASKSDQLTHWNQIADLCSFNIVCRKRSREDSYLLEISLVLKPASISFDNGESASFSVNFISHSISQLIKQKLISESFLVESQSGTYKIRYNNVQSLKRFARKYACSSNLYYDFNVNGCLSCPKGYYRIESEGFLTCTPCSSNLWSLSDYYVNVNPCTATCGKGSYSVEGSHPCELCPIGTYQPQSGRISCQSCGSGVDTTVSGSQTFQDCLVKEYCRSGFYFDEKSSKCTPCPRGYYQPEKGLNYCIECPKNTTTDEPASSSIDQCKSTVCTHFRSKLGGYIESPNYPSNYPSNTLCFWDVKAPGQNKILVFMPDVTLPADDCRDYLVMRKSESPYSPTSFETCDSLRKPTAFVARTRKLFIEFASDFKNNAKGFRIFYAFYHDQYQSLIEDIVKDDRIYDLPNHESLLRNGHFLSALMDIMSEPSNYQKYMNVSTALFPRSFVEILWPKLHRFFDVADF